MANVKIASIFTNQMKLKAYTFPLLETHTHKSSSTLRLITKFNRKISILIK